MTTIDEVQSLGDEVLIARLSQSVRNERRGAAAMLSFAARTMRSKPTAFSDAHS